MPSPRLEKLSLCLQNVLANKLVSTSEQLGELTIVLHPADTLSVMETLRDHSELDFDTLIDVCGVDYLTYGAESIAEANWQGKRFAA
ncbi:MAG: NADH-quinone oxidoreductase subunit C, partial [Pseudomonadota bacterium]